MHAYGDYSFSISGNLPSTNNNNNNQLLLDPRARVNSIQEQENKNIESNSKGINYNDKSTRLTIWALIYCIIFIAQLNQNGIILAVLNGEADFSGYYRFDPIRSSYRLIIIGHCCFMLAAIWILLDVPFNNNKISRSIIFVLLSIGSLFQIIYCIQSTVKECSENSDIYPPDLWAPDSFDTSDECRLQHVTISIFISMISVYLAFDVYIPNGISIKYRCIILSFIVTLHSSLRCGELFKVYSNNIQRSEASIIYLYFSIVIAHTLLCLLCLLIIFHAISWLPISAICKKLIIIIMLFSVGLIFSFIWLDLNYMSSYYSIYPAASDNRNIAVSFIIIPIILFLIHDILFMDKEYVINMNKINVRSTCWYIIYLIISTAEINSYITAYIHINNSDYSWSDDAAFHYFSMMLANIIILIATLLLLFNQIGEEKQNIKLVASVFTFIDSLFMIFISFRGLSVFCKTLSGPYGYNWWSYNNKDCKISYIECIIFYAPFLMYLAIDNFYRFGDNINIRILIKSLLLSIFALMMGYNSLNIYYTDIVNNDSDPKLKWSPFYFRYITTGNIWVGLYYYFMGVICGLIFIVFSLRLKCKVNIWRNINKYIPLILILCTGYIFILPTYFIFASVPSYLSYHAIYIYIPAVLFLIHDIQSVVIPNPVRIKPALN